VRTQLKRHGLIAANAPEPPADDEGEDDAAPARSAGPGECGAGYALSPV